MHRPNILWILCDELRTDALGCYGNDYVDVRTPNIDSLAMGGIMFDNFFVSSPVCVSSRASMLTGLYPEQTAIYHNEAHWRHYRSPSVQLTFPEVFARFGYTTADFGKMHIPRVLTPWQIQEPDGSEMGFFRVVNRDRLQLIRTPMGFGVGGRFPNAVPYPPGRVTSNARSWLERAPSPFLCRVSYLQPHTPVIPPATYADRYANNHFPDAIDFDGTPSEFERRFGEINGGAQMPSRDLVLAQMHYHGLVGWIDDQVAQLLAALRAKNLERSTIVLFTSDHGAHLGEWGAFGKHTFAPQVHRVPLILFWPGVLPVGIRDEGVAEGVDLAPTLLSLAGLGTSGFIGRNLLTEPPRLAVFSTIGYGEVRSRAFPNLATGSYTNGRGWPRRSCVRTQRYRLDRNVRIDGHPAEPAEQDVFLADMKSDPKERHNIAATKSAVRDELLKLLKTHTEGAVEVPAMMVYQDEQIDQHFELD
jgi:arylsulfatase A-like enzyme